ncbi:MAG: four helix bundle protein [Marinirhabdus sp.]|nr:four helix bundle protein [Marinirhabdus sp.]
MGLPYKTFSLSFKFEKLIIWQKAMELGEDTHKLSKSFPKSERYNLSSQIRRAGDSVALNISEGSILQSNREFKKFLGYAIRSIAEIVTCLHKAVRRNYIDINMFNKLYKDCFNLINMTISFRNSLT